MTINEYAIARLKAKLDKAAETRKLTAREKEIHFTVSQLVAQYAAREEKKTSAAGS